MSRTAPEALVEAIIRLADRKLLLKPSEGGKKRFGKIRHRPYLPPRTWRSMFVTA